MAKLIRVWDGTTWQSVGVAAAQGPTGPTGPTGATGPQGATGASGAPAVTNQSISSNITLSAGVRYFVDTTAARTLTLPASPSVGDEIQMFDASGTAATNNITIARNGSKINAQTEDAIIDVNQASSTFVYTGATVGWRFD